MGPSGNGPRGNGLSGNGLSGNGTTLPPLEGTARSGRSLWVLTGTTGYSPGTRGRYPRPHALRGPHRRGARRRSPVGVGRSLQRSAGPPPPVTTCRATCHCGRRHKGTAEQHAPPPPLCRSAVQRSLRSHAVRPIPLGPFPLRPFPLGPFPLTARFAAAQPCHAIPFHSHGRYDTLPNALFCAAVAQRRASAVYASLC